MKRFKSMQSIERKALILKITKSLGVEIGSGIPHKKHDNKDVYELLQIAKCFPELRAKK